MGGKYKIGPGIRKRKSQLCQFLFYPLSRSYNFSRGCFKISIILHCFHTHYLRRQVHGVGVKGKLHVIQIVDQFLVADAETDTHSRHSSGLGKCLNDQQIFVFFKQRQCTFATEIHISLVHDHYHIRICLQDLLNCFKRFLHAGRSVGIREDDTAVRLFIIFRMDMPVFIQCTGAIWNPVQICPYIIKGIGDVREQNRLTTVKESHKGHRQYIVRTDSHEYLLRFYIIICCQGIHQRLGI